MQTKNDIISSNKDRRIYNILQDPELKLADIFYDYINVEQVTKCWNWTGSKVVAGYGYIKIYSKEICYSHRLSYMIFKGLIPLRYQIDHLCKNKSCCNPAHLEAVTQKENTLRGKGLASQNAKKTHCPRGHLLSGNNLDKYSLSKGKRVCLICKNEKQSIRRKNASREKKDHTNLVHNQWRWRKGICKKRDTK